MLYQFTSYRAYLRGVLSDRIARNPRYSLRAFARDMGLSPGICSQVLSGQKNLSFERAEVLAERLNLSQQDQEYFRLLVRKDKTKSMALKNEVEAQLRTLQVSRARTDIRPEAFSLMSDWFYLPILEMTNLDEALTAEFAATKLGISSFDAQTAIDNLLATGLLRKNEEGRLEKVFMHPTVRRVEPDNGLRAFHKAMLKKGIDSLENQSPEEKFVGSETMAIDPKRVKEVSQRIDRFLNEVSEQLDTDDVKEELYHLSVQFFRIGNQKVRRIADHPTEEKRYRDDSIAAAT